MSLTRHSSGTLHPFDRTLAAKLFLALLIGVSLLCLFARIDNLHFIEESLWYEDGLIHINQADAFGIRALWVPYGGYLMVYNRLGALLASQFPLIATPYIFFSGWVLAFLSIPLALHARGNALALDKPLILCLVSAVALQPNHGEPFFNLNHAHFFLEIALTIYVCTARFERRLSFVEAIFLLIASLSGPLSAILLPLLAAQLVILRDFKTRTALYLIVGTCGAIQFAFLLDRVPHSATGINYARLIDAIRSFIFFGGTSNLVALASVAFWIITAAYFIKHVTSAERRADRDLWLAPIFAAAVGVSLFFLEIVLSEYYLPTLDPLDIGARYFLIPYSLAFLVALVFTKCDSRASTAAISLIFIICSGSFLTVDRPDRSASTGMLSHENLQWGAFTRLQKIKPELIIPINSPIPIYPPVRVQLIHPRTATDSPPQPASIQLAPQYGTSTPQSLEADFHVDVPLSVGSGPVVYFDVANHCAKSAYLALEAEIWRSSMGWVSVYWGHAAHFGNRQSLKRFYPAGTFVMQFAFRRDIVDDLILLYPTEGVADTTVVRSVALFGSRGAFPPGTTIAEPTEPGGEFRIDGVRLYCLQ